MLPLFRLIPVGGVLLAIAILLLALNPPRATSPSARAALQPARGAMIDRTEHPEWRQFLIQAALRRADEVERLRDLRDTVIRSEPPVAMVPTPAPVEPAPNVAKAAPTEARPEIAEAVSAEPAADEPKVARAAPAEAGPEAAAPTDTTPVEAQPETPEPAPLVAEHEPVPNEPKPVTAEPKIAATAPIEATPEVIIEPKVADATAVEAQPQAAEPAQVAVQHDPVANEPDSAVSNPEPLAAEPKIAEAAADVVPAPLPPKPEREAPTQLASIAPIPAQDPGSLAAAAPPQQDVAAPASSLETNGSRIRADVAPPPATRIAGLPEQPVEKDSDDITGSIEPADRTATIPVGIGEASSTELTVTLPRERPPVLRQLDLRRARDTKVKQPQRRVHHVSRARNKTKPEVIPPELALFALLIKAFDPDARFDPNAKFEPIKPAIPYVPNNSWQKQTPAR